ncbi:hypothetical protein [Pseudomonas sp. LB3P14]
MTTRVYKHLPGMEMKFVSGKLERDVAQRAIFYEATWELKLDFVNFVVMANLFIPNYLQGPTNAVRPEFNGSAYHYSYNYFFGAAGNIGDNPSLFDVFTDPIFYMDQWSSGGGSLERRYGKPSFNLVNNDLQMTVRQYFRLGPGDPPIGISDLPFIWFEWALNLMQGELKNTTVSPETKVVVMQAEEALVDVGGGSVFKRTPYLDNSALTFGPITSKQILIAM